MIRLRLLFFIVSIALSLNCSAQVILASAEALKKYESITATMSKSFPENEFKTYRRESFTEQQLQTYLFQHYQRLDLLPYIEKQHIFKLNSYLHSGNWFREIGFPEESIKWYRKFFNYYANHEQDLTKTDKQELVEMITYSYSNQADNYAKIGQLDSAAIEHKKNIQFIRNMDIISNPSAFNNYGLFFYWTKKDLDSAMVYFNKAYQITRDQFSNHTLLGSIRDNIADIYTNQNQYEKALPLYLENFKLYQGTKNESSNAFDVTRFISAGIQLIETQLKLDNISQAQETFNDLQNTLEMTEFKDNIRQQSQLEILQAEKSLYQSQGNYKAALDIADKRLVLLDSFNAISKLADKKWQDELNAISLDRFALNSKIDRIETENKIQNQRSKLWIITLSSSIVLILLLSLFLRRRQHIINAKNRQLLAEQKLEISSVKNENLQSEIESKQRDLSDFAINLTQNQEWAQDLANKLETIKEAPSEEKKELLAHLEKDIQNKITFDTNTHEFYERLDKLSDAFYSKLNGLFTNLSKNEIRMCSLIRLKMDSRSIATLQNITLASLNTSRYRLRKKLNLSENEDLDTFIQSL